MAGESDDLGHAVVGREAGPELLGSMVELQSGLFGVFFLGQNPIAVRELMYGKE